MTEIDPRGKMVRKALLVGAYDKAAGKSEAESLLAMDRAARSVKTTP